MPGMHESCTVCGRNFEVQFRYQMEEKDNAFSFFCSQACHSKSLRGEATSGQVCDACHKRFVVELVSQVVRIKGQARYACSEGCRSQLLAEAGGQRLGAPTLAMAGLAPVVTPAASPPPATALGSATVPAPASTTASAAVPVTTPAASPASAGPAGDAPAFFAPSSSPAVTPIPPTSVPRAAASGVVPFAGPRRMAIFNHKGGTGKTMISVSVVVGFVQRGYKVLLVDTDSQGNVGVSLGVKSDKTLYHCLVMGLKPQDVAVKVRDNLDVLPSNETLAAAELYLAGRQNRDRILKDRLAAAAGHYDVIMLDCSPSLSLLNQNALVFADGILVPVACDFLSLVGVRQVIKTVKNVNSLLHHPVQIYGVLPTFYDARARICRDAWSTLKEHFNERCFQPIRSTTKVKEAPSQGKTIYEWAPDSNAALDYMRTVDRIITGRCAELDPEAEETEAEAMTG